MGQTLSEPIVDKSSDEGKNQHLIFGLSSMQGWRLTMEDAHCTELDLEKTGASFFGVYDGHGGSSVAKHTGEHLHLCVRGSKHFDKKEYAEALVDGYMSMDRLLAEDPQFAGDSSGCTAVAGLWTPDQKKILVANAGDSRAILSTQGKSKALSYDHKPSNIKESERIKNAGGFVEFNRVNGNLALSRAIGDFEFKQSHDLPPEKQVVTCHPDVIEHTLSEQDEFVVLACDGIWDCMTNQQVVNFVRQHLAEKTRLSEICELLMDHCLSPENDGGGVGCDNMTVIIVGLLQGKSEEDWYTWMAERAAPPKKDALGNDIENKA